MTKVKLRSSLTGICLVSTLFLASCAGPVLRDQFHSYNAAYADMLNDQMLLNLARLDNGHPPYYLAVGPINHKFSFSAEASGGANHSSTDTDTVVTQEQDRGGLLGLVSRTITGVSSTVFGYNGSGRVVGQSNPDFQFIPLNNETVAKQVLEPISTDVFFALYQQGFPIDQLLRILIERIETMLPDTREELVLVNSPTRGTEDSYARFLRVCAILHEMQRLGALVLETRYEFDPLGQASFGTTGTSVKDFHPTADELSRAETQSLNWRRSTNGTWQIGRNRGVPTFYLKPEKAAQVKQQLFDLSVTRDKAAIENVIQLLSDGITVKVRPESAGQAKTRLVLRSFARAMEAVASEQEGFDLLMKKALFATEVPLSEQRPILRTIWTDYKGPLVPPVRTLRYAGKSYQITDPVTDPLNQAERWNRDVFRLMAALASQVTVDISKFQRSVLELR